MAKEGGVIAIMGSGEISDSMVRVHRFLLQKISPPPRAVFIDTPAGFQLNADELYEKARDYFLKRLGHPLEQVSFKSSRQISPLEAVKAFQILKQANYIFVGPGSPTYALKNWLGTPIPQIISERIEKGACFVAASAAALTLGRFTLPVYEIYKVGEDPRWERGLDLLGKFGLPCVVIPHWNNAEGGTHDTRYCYMGESRLSILENILPEDIPILGIDEHTACILDFDKDQALIQGIGTVTLRYKGTEKIFRSGQILNMAEIRDFVSLSPPKTPSPPKEGNLKSSSFQEKIQNLKNLYFHYLENQNGAALADILIQVDKLIWEAYHEDKEKEFPLVRSVFWEMIAQMGLLFSGQPQDLKTILTPLINLFLDVRQKLRAQKNWSLADEIRQRLGQEGIVVEDTEQGPRWYFQKKEQDVGKKNELR